MALFLISQAIFFPLHSESMAFKPMRHGRLSLKKKKKERKKKEKERNRIRLIKRAIGARFFSGGHSDARSAG